MNTPDAAADLVVPGRRRSRALSADWAWTRTWMWTRKWSAVLAVGAVVGCDADCRAIEARPIAVECADTSSFMGELHFDDRATWQSFLSLNCLPGAELEVLEDLVNAVDFTDEVAFVAVGTRGQSGRCITERSADTVEVCAAGLRIGFRDEESEDAPCAGKWTAGLAVPRAEMRAALAAR